MAATQFFYAFTSQRTLNCLWFFGDYEKNCNKPLFLYGHMFSFLKSKYVGVGLWGCMVSICLAL